MNINPYQAPSLPLPTGDLIGPGFQPREMEAHFELQPDDLVAFNLHYLRHSQAIRDRRRRAMLRLACALAALAVVLFILTGGEMGGVWIVVLLIVMGTMMVAASPRARRRIVGRQLAQMLADGKNAGLYGHHCLRISPQGIREEVSVGYTFRCWEVVEKIDVTDAYAFLYIGAARAFMLPKRALGTELQFQQFVRSAQLWMEQSHHDVARL